MAQFTVTNLDFDQIKQSIVDYFKADPKYSDWNFEGSGLSVLMDVLAYNTHYNALLAHLSLNETFLDSAQLRGNVVGHAKLLGYVPRSMISATAVVDIVVPAIGITPPSTILLERGTRFSTVVDSVKYTFVNLDPVEAILNVESNSYAFTDIHLHQGSLKRMLYTVDTSVANQKFVIPDVNADTTTLRVRIKSNAQATDYSVYKRFTSLSGVDANSQIYFLQENSEGSYEVYFGDDTLGVKPIDNQVVELEYVYTDGPVANGANAYVALDSIGGSTTISVTASLDGDGNVVRSYGGADRETVESVRYNAPLTFITQNRAVTADDYRAIILREVGNIQAISVWGGEYAPTPDYGKVYICIKPTGAAALTSAEKSAIEQILKGKNVVSITPVLVDPEYTYLSLDVFFKYNPNLTDRTKVELESAVRNTVSEYNDNNLEKFDGVFRSSQILRAIDSTDASILNSDVRVFMYKDITALSTINNSFDLQFTAPIYKTSSNESVISSTAFLINGVPHYFGDSPISGSSNRQVFIYKTVNGSNTTVVADAGTIFTLDGRVTLKNFRPDAETVVRITVVPNSNDLAPKRNQLIAIDPLEVGISGDVDTIAVAGAVGAIDYTTPARHRS